ncbi:MAG: GatB/YqeY domain-containing protein [Candidatus Gracilibacteria bacterium]
MALKNQIQADMIAAMKAHDEIKVSTLRMLKAAVLKQEVSGERKEATDEVILGIIGKEIKARRDSAEQFRNGGRMEMAEKEEKEIEVLLGYMPPQMSEDELKKVAQEVIAAMGASSKADLGKVMGAMMGKVKGMADGDMVSKVVKSLLP